MNGVLGSRSDLPDGRNAVVPVTTPVADAPVGYQLTNKEFLGDDQLWERLVLRIAGDEDVSHSLAERIMDRALGFLKLCKLEPGCPYGPSKLVDIGWHTFILDTAQYANFCQRVVGWFIHHIPAYELNSNHNPSGLADTVEALRRHGITVDEALWADSAQDCWKDWKNCKS
jgi:hypothetical protein